MRNTLGRIQDRETRLIVAKRMILAMLSSGWVLPMYISATSTVQLLVLRPTGIQSFPRLGLASPPFFLGLAWFAVVVTFWTWRYGGRAWWAIAALSVAGLIPLWVSARHLFALMQTVLGSGSSMPPRVPDAALLMARGADQVLLLGALWVAAVVVFWSWRLAVDERDWPSGDRPNKRIERTPRALS